MFVKKRISPWTSFVFHFLCNARALLFYLNSYFNHGLNYETSLKRTQPVDKSIIKTIEDFEISLFFLLLGLSLKKFQWSLMIRDSLETLSLKDFPLRNWRASLVPSLASLISLQNARALGRVFLGRGYKKRGPRWTKAVFFKNAA